MVLFRHQARQIAEGFASVWQPSTVNVPQPQPRVGARSSGKNAEGRRQRRESEGGDSDGEAETAGNPKPSGSRRRHLQVRVGFEIGERLAQLDAYQRCQRLIRSNAPGKSERASKPVERHLGGARRAAPAMSGNMRDDMVTHLAEPRPRQVGAQTKVEGALDCDKEVGVVAVACPANRIKRLHEACSPAVLQNDSF